MSSESNSEVVLLGPQRHAPNLRDAMKSHGPLLDPGAAPIAAVTAGWEEREGEDNELHEHVGHPIVNLGVYQRVEGIFQRDQELFDAAKGRHQTLRRLREVYRMRLGHAMTSARTLLAAEPDESIGHYIADECEAAIDMVRTIDEDHITRVRDVYSAFEERWHPGERDEVAKERAEVARALAGCGPVLVAGGHIAILVGRMRLLGIDALLTGHTVFAWSAGAMALSDRLVLFHDSPPQGPGDAEVLEAGFGRVSGIVPLPHANHRLRLDDPTRVELFARRFAPAACITLDDGALVTREEDGWQRNAHARLLEPSGELTGTSA